MWRAIIVFVSALLTAGTADDAQEGECQGEDCLTFLQTRMHSEVSASSGMDLSQEVDANALLKLDSALLTKYAATSADALNSDKFVSAEGVHKYHESKMEEYAEALGRMWNRSSSLYEEKRAQQSYAFRPQMLDTANEIMNSMPSGDKFVRDAVASVVGEGSPFMQALEPRLQDVNQLYEKVNGYQKQVSALLSSVVMHDERFHDIFRNVDKNRGPGISQEEHIMNQAPEILASLRALVDPVMEHPSVKEPLDKYHALLQEQVVSMENAGITREMVTEKQASMEASKGPKEDEEDQELVLHFMVKAQTHCSEIQAETKMAIASCLSSPTQMVPGSLLTFSSEANDASLAEKTVCIGVGRLPKDGETAEAKTRREICKTLFDIQTNGGAATQSKWCFRTLRISSKFVLADQSVPELVNFFHNRIKAQFLPRGFKEDRFYNTKNAFERTRASDTVAEMCRGVVDLGIYLLRADVEKVDKLGLATFMMKLGFTPSYVTSDQRMRVGMALPGMAMKFPRSPIPRPGLKGKEDSAKIPTDYKDFAEKWLDENLKKELSANDQVAASLQSEVKKLTDAITTKFIAAKQEQVNSMVQLNSSVMGDDGDHSFFRRVLSDRKYRFQKFSPAGVDLEDFKAWLTPQNFKVSMALRFMWRCYCRNWSVKFAIPSPLQMAGFKAPMKMLIQFSVGFRQDMDRTREVYPAPGWYAAAGWGFGFLGDRICMAAKHSSARPHPYVDFFPLSAGISEMKLARAGWLIKMGVNQAQKIPWPGGFFVGTAGRYYKNIQKPRVMSLGLWYHLKPFVGGFEAAEGADQVENEMGTIGSNKTLRVSYMCHDFPPTIDGQEVPCSKMFA